MDEGMGQLRPQPQSGGQFAAMLLGVAGEVIEDQGDGGVQDEAALGHGADAGVNPVGIVAALAGDSLNRPTLLAEPRTSHPTGRAPADQLPPRPEPLKGPRPSLPASHESMYVKCNYRASMVLDRPLLFCAT